MPGTVPSDIVREIERLFPFTIEQAAGRLQQEATIDYAHATRVRTIVDLCRRLPQDLLPVDPRAFARYRRALMELEHHVERWDHGDGYRNVTMTSVREERPLSPLAILLQVLRECPDDRVEAAGGVLAFVVDPDVRADLAQDIADAERAVGEGQWKAATVLAGSAVEALLLWGLTERKTPSEVKAAAAAAVAHGRLTRAPGADLNRWVLGQYIAVAYEAGLVKDDTATQADLARDFRDLIHPGRVQRKGKRCGKETAHAALAAVHCVLRDLA